MALSLWYRFDGTTAELVDDSSGNGRNLTNTAVTSGSYGSGTAAYFTPASKMTLPLASVPTLMSAPTQPMTISFWFARTAGGDRTLMKLGSSGNNSVSLIVTNELGIRLITTNNKDSPPDGIVSGLSHFVFTYGYNNGVGTLDYGVGILGYINGVLRASGQNKNLNNLTRSDLEIGGDYTGYIADFRVYDGVMSSPDIESLYNGGLYAPFNTFTTTMYTHLADLEWSSSQTASFYRITRIENGGSEEIIDSSGTDLTYVMNGLVPSSTYVFNIYVDSDFITPFLSKTDSTPVLNSTSVSDIITRLSNDLSNLSGSSLSDLEPFFRQVLTTGQKLKVAKRKNHTFVENAGTVKPRGRQVGVLTPFDPSSGNSQAINIEVDGITENVTYDDVNNEIGVGGSSIAVNEYFVVGTYKVTVDDN